eukprot:1185396-Prorocentrum_minimum.AAC.3
MLRRIKLGRVVCRSSGVPIFKLGALASRSRRDFRVLNRKRFRVSTCLLLWVIDAACRPGCRPHTERLRARRDRRRNEGLCVQLPPDRKLRPVQGPLFMEDPPRISEP